MDQNHVILTVLPSRGLVDEKFSILIQLAKPGSQLTVRAWCRCEDGHSWESFAHFRADASGSVNVSEDLSLGGTFSGNEPMGLMWSLRPVPGSKTGLRMRKLDVQTPLEVSVSVHPGHLTQGFQEQPVLAQVLVERWYLAPGVQRIPVNQDGLTAMLFLPPGPGPFPGVLDLWGGSGKLVESRSALLASHGFAALALDYLTNRITMETGKLVDDSYFEAAYRFLQQQPRVLGSSIGLVGLSFGAALTMKFAAYSDLIQLRCAVSVSGSHVQPADASLEQIMGYFKTHSEKLRVNEENQSIMRDLLLPVPTDPALRVDMGRVRCPLMLIVGEDDQNWPAPESAQDIKEMMEAAGNGHLLTVLSYPNTGHLIEPPYTPHTRVSLFVSVGSRQKFMNLWGGEMVAHAHAQEDAWRKMLLFLRENLYRGRDSAPTPLAHL